MTQDCLICKTKFEASHSQKTCSETCRTVHRKNRRKTSDENITVTRTCKFCNSDFKAKRYKPKAFCNRSCASKHYIQSGTYDKWRLRANERKGFYRPCTVCNKLIYLEPRFENMQNLVKVCDIECEKEHFQKLFANGGSMLGKTLTPEQKQKQKETLKERYGVNNAYMLAKRDKISKPQKQLFDLLSEWYGCQLEVLLPFHTIRCFADILIPDKTTIVEFMGDYWHCNPKHYDGNYFHKKKAKLAKEIWEEDKKRKDILERLGYNVLYVWECDYKENKDQVVKTLKEKINEFK